MKYSSAAQAGEERGEEKIERLSNFSHHGADRPPSPHLTKARLSVSGPNKSDAA
jgi:hypothetical protein